MNRATGRQPAATSAALATLFVVCSLVSTACTTRNPHRQRAISDAGASAATTPRASSAGPPTNDTPSTPTTPTATPTTEAPVPPTSAPLGPDPGVLGQTHELPSASDPAWLARASALGRAVVDGQPAEALGSFFPRAAYLQVKTFSDPGADWNHRLLAQFNADIGTLHRALGPGIASFAGVDVPSAATTWVTPGSEFNRIGYYRVYGTRIRFTVNGQSRAFTIASLISWRGQWYVVHILRIA